MKTKFRTRSLGCALVAALASILSGCGGGGGKDSAAQAACSASSPCSQIAGVAALGEALPAPGANPGDYAGTYRCASHAEQPGEADFILTATVPARGAAGGSAYVDGSGYFESCAFSIHFGTLSFPCDGWVSDQGALYYQAWDTRGNGAVPTGRAAVSGAAASGSFSAPAVGIQDWPFTCTRS
ncbi:hypothetical protein [Piscinibacter sp.]|uniref:hypothetical protein n=1 Tax=Piscinibacter sp. TaxID=1903157 RepID=UPI0039E696DB